MNGNQEAVCSHEDFFSGAVEINSSILVAVRTATPKRDTPDHATVPGINGQKVIDSTFSGGSFIAPVTAMSEDNAALPSKHAHGKECVVLLVPNYIGFLLGGVHLNLRQSRLVRDVLGSRKIDSVAKIVWHIHGVVDANHGGFVAAAHLGKHWRLGDCVSRFVIVDHRVHLRIRVVCDGYHPLAGRFVHHNSGRGSRTHVVLPHFQEATVGVRGLPLHCEDAFGVAHEVAVPGSGFSRCVQTVGNEHSTLLGNREGVVVVLLVRRVQFLLSQHVWLHVNVTLGLRDQFHHSDVGAFGDGHIVPLRHFVLSAEQTPVEIPLAPYGHDRVKCVIVFPGDRSYDVIAGPDRFQLVHFFLFGDTLSRRKRLELVIAHDNGVPVLVQKEVAPSKTPGQSVADAVAGDVGREDIAVRVKNNESEYPHLLERHPDHLVVLVAAHYRRKPVGVELLDDAQPIALGALESYGFGAVAVLVSAAPIVLLETGILRKSDARELVVQAPCWLHGVKRLASLRENDVRHVSTFP